MHYLGGEVDGQTPLDPDEAEGLLRTTITTQGELDEVEQEAIHGALPWALRPRAPLDVLDEAFLRELHRRMFSPVWSWAGAYRRSDKNIGVPWWQVRDEVGTLIGDARYWLEQDTFSPDELCIQVKHRLVSHIHAFPNGNGRHSRLLADVLATSLGVTAFSWGANAAVAAGPLRQMYLDALRAADGGEIGLLLRFARS